MDENVPAPESPTAQSPARRPRLGLALFAAALVVAVVYLLWQRIFGGGAISEDVQGLRTQVATLARDVAQLHGITDTLRARLEDREKVDKSVREQFLGLSERTRLLEDSMANLADKRLSAHDTFALDEAELLLTLGGERYALFRDSRSALSAYQHADTVLSEVEDAAFATVRQSIAAEMTAMNDAHVADAAALTLRLARLREQALSWPPRPLGLPPVAPAPDTQLTRLLAAFVQVRHDNTAPMQAALHAPHVARELFLLDLREAEAAALARDDTRYRAAVQSARGQFAAAFDTQAPAVAAAAGEFDSLAQVTLEPAPPAILGASLKELRNLRATHALREVKAAPRAPGDAK